MSDFYHDESRRLQQRYDTRRLADRTGARARAARGRARPQGVPMPQIGTKEKPRPTHRGRGFALVLVADARDQSRFIDIRNCALLGSIVSCAKIAARFV